jgi:hypothetical protein
MGTQDEDKQSRETGNIGYKRRRQTKQKHNISQLKHEPFYKRWQVMDEPKKNLKKI